MSAHGKGLRIGAALAAILLAGALAGQEGFRSKTADRYRARQKQGDLVVAVKAFVTEKDQKSAFGKVRPYEVGVTPILLVVSNTGTDTFTLENLQVRLITSGREGLEPTRGEDLATIKPHGHQPTRRSIPGIPGLNRTRVKKGPLDRPEVTLNEFAAPIVAPKSTASGFLYYLTGNETDPLEGSVYISGIVNLSTGRELFYFEIPLRKS